MVSIRPGGGKKKELMKLSYGRTDGGKLTRVVSWVSLGNFLRRLVNKYVIYTKVVDYIRSVTQYRTSILTLVFSDSGTSTVRSSF